MASALVTCDALIEALRNKLAGMTDAELADFKKYLQIPENIYVAEATWSEDKKKILLKRTDGVILEINMCDYRAPQPCEYYATALIKACSKVCGKPDRVAWAYHPDDIRDPAANVRLANKDDETLAWLYPNEAPAHNIDVRDEKTQEVVGYAMASNVRRIWGEDCGCNDKAVGNATQPAQPNQPGGNANQPGGNANQPGGNANQPPATPPATPPAQPTP